MLSCSYDQLGWSQLPVRKGMPAVWVRLGWEAPANQDENCSMLLSRVETDLISSARYQEKCPSNLFPRPEAVSLQG